MASPPFVPPFVPMAPPPLLPGWTEHVGPGGQPYYYNAHTKESTYVRPLPTAFPAPMHVPGALAQPAKKKERPVKKVPIPSTDWLRVTTTEGNVFYTHKTEKRSVWTVPEEIKEAVEALEREEASGGKRAPSNGKEDEEVKREVKRVKREAQAAAKRKAEEAVPVEEVVIMKKAKVEDEADEKESEGEDESESEEEEWQREAAAQLAAEAEEEEKRRKEEEEARKKAEAEAEAERAKQAAAMPQLNMPDRVDLSIDEAKALFKTLLREKDINPLMPWDAALPQFVSDPRYVLLPSVSARREAFDEYCRDRARELRESRVKKEKELADPKEAFDRLLREEVNSTRTSWNDFRRQWKKDRRFWGWGRDEREREKKFREYLRELGEKKRAAAQKAEADFFALLKESERAKLGSDWKEVKKHLYSDPRYDAVGSSSLREELFNTFLKAQSGADTPEKPSSKVDEVMEEKNAEEKDREKREKKERAVRERQEKVQAERSKLEQDINRSKMGLTLEEGEREFRTMLVDAIRDPQMTWEQALPQLKTDPRFTRSPLPHNQQLHLFHTHIGRLRTKHLDDLHALFISHSPSLSVSFSDLPVASLLSSLPATKLGFDSKGLQHEYEKWQRERNAEARAAFDAMLHENAFVEFWGRLKNMGGEGVEGGVKADPVEEGEGEGGGGTADMKALARTIDIREIENVLKNDKRYLMFDHVPEQRERWVRGCRRPNCPCMYRSISTKYALVGRLNTAYAPGWATAVLSSAMRLFRPILLSLGFLASLAWAQEVPDLDSPAVPKEKHSYQSDVARLRKIVINSLYSHRDVFIRELISNANDALEKLRLTALKDSSYSYGVDGLNITIKAVKNPDGPGGKLIIADTGIGMSPEELTTNLGTLAKSGTSDFLARAESSDATGQGNLIGAFGLGFYSSFLVADRVYVASLPPQSARNPNPTQYVFSSSADDSSFETYPDPRGNTLARGTEITLVLKEDAAEYLDQKNIMDLVSKHSSFSSTFPIYLFTERDEEVPVVEEAEEKVTSEKSGDEDEAVVEEVEEEEEEEKPVKTKTVHVEEWVQLNPEPPIWMREPKDVSDDEYERFYQATFKDYEKPLAWHHFAGDSGSGVSFRAIIYIPSRLDESFWQQQGLASSTIDVRLMVKRVFITSDLGEDSLPKWAGWVKAIIDAEDLPLNVSRETLQSTKFLKQIRSIVLRHIIQMLTKLSEEDKEKFDKVQEVYGTALKLGAVEDKRNQQKLASLTRFASNQREKVGLDEYVEGKRKGQKQIFYLADIGKSTKALADSVFVEKLTARGYEVLLLNEPLDEILVQNMRRWKGMTFQDVAKAGLEFGDEESDPEDEKKVQEAQKERFQPLVDYLKEEAKDLVRDVVISNRLVTSPCAIVADQFGYTANVQKMMSASNSKQAQGPMFEFAKKQRLLEINPRSPLIEGLLRRVKQLPGEDEERDLEAEEDLREVVSILVDGALVRSGFDVPNSNEFFKRVDRVLRRSLGVSETAEADDTVKPAPPVDPSLPPEIPDNGQVQVNWEDKVGVQLPDDLKDKVSIELEEIDEEGNPVHPGHDEL
ncbi:HSP90-domain-containing protein [Neolentinus lepideus HHB14362 ss-1]|uniref:HSP90-domain-containing protein n=1 Tax=Neolentinus lepideus HHB14362 ss-1 TaxID=1314782 RepID=A0A165S0Y9_9AGAM|nr:HSP90-domain-containing protein [Neolentinus lepideus HHB14362 ss-1]